MLPWYAMVNVCFYMEAMEKHPFRPHNWLQKTHKARCKDKASHFSKVNLIYKNHKHAFGLQNRLSLYLAKSS